MRYEIADLDGRSCGEFASPGDLLRELDEIRQSDPESIAELFVVKYDDHGNRTGSPLPAAILLPRSPSDVGATLFSEVHDGPGSAYVGPGQSISTKRRVPA